MFEHFWQCKENLTGGYGFDFFSFGHFVELGIFVVFTAILTYVYHLKEQSIKQKLKN